MGQITAYKCDVCGKISEEPLLAMVDCYYSHDKSPTNDFTVILRSPTGYRQGACSIECLKLRLDQWIRDKQKEAEIEKLTNEGLQYTIEGKAIEEIRLQGPPSLANAKPISLDAKV